MIILLAYKRQPSATSRLFTGRSTGKVEIILRAFVVKVNG
jgi:hypothetical protein